MNTKFRTQYNSDHSAVSKAVGLRCDDPSLAVQHERDECDINVIVERFGVGVPAPISAKLPSYGDYEGIFDFQSAMNVVVSAERSFMELPAKVRSRFSNNPAQFLDFVNNPENCEELVKMGLATKREPVPANPVASEAAGSVSPPAGSDAGQA